MEALDRVGIFGSGFWNLVPQMLYPQFYFKHEQ